MIPIFRILYGNYDYGSGKRCVKLIREVKRSLQLEWAREEIIHLVLGEQNAETLKKYGAKRIELIDKNPSLSESKISHFYNKTSLILKAFDKYSDGEILVIDFDTICGKTPDQKMLDLLRSKKGKFNGTLQCPVVCYKMKICLAKKHGGLRVQGVHPLRQCLNTSFVYCTDRTWLVDHLDYYTKYQKLGGGKRDTSTVNDEAVLMYNLDMKYGIMFPDELVENFEPDVVELCRSINQAKAIKNKDNLYFSHY